MDVGEGFPAHGQVCPTPTPRSLTKIRDPDALQLGGMSIPYSITMDVVEGVLAHG